MKRYLISLALLTLNILPMLAYDRHGKDYSVRDGGGSSGFLALLVIIGIIAYAYFSGGKKDR